MTLFIAVAVPSLFYRNGALAANAEEVQTAANKEQTQPTETPETPADPAPQPQRVLVIIEDSISYSGTAYKLNTALYVMNKIENVDGQEVPEARNAGKYTVYYTPAANFVWEGVGGTFEKTLKLTIEKATLEWFFPQDTAMAEPKADIVYA